MPRALTPRACNRAGTPNLHCRKTGNQAGSEVENRVEHGLKFAAAGPWDVGAKHHVRLPDLIGKLGLELFVSRRGKQLFLGEPLILRKRLRLAADKGGILGSIDVSTSSVIVCFRRDAGSPVSSSRSVQPVAGG